MLKKLQSYYLQRRDAPVFEKKVDLLIDPTKEKLSREESLVLDALLKNCKQRKKDRRFIKAHKSVEVTYIDEDGKNAKRMVKVTHDIYHFLNNKKEDRYAVLDPKLFGKGASGDVNKVLATIEPLKFGGVKVKKYTQRVMKFIKFKGEENKVRATPQNVTSEAKILQRLIHTGSKPELILENEGAIILHKLGDQRLDKVINNKKIGDRTLDTMDYFDLTIKLLNTHIEQHINRGILHRDIKAANINIDSDTGEVIFLDYGSSTDLESQKDVQEGTMLYAAPEVLKGERQTGALDIYSLGILITLLWGTNDPAKPDTTIEREKLDGKFSLPVGFKDIENINDQKEAIKEIISNMVSYDPGDRISAKDALKNFEEERLRYLFHIENSNLKTQEKVRTAIELAKEDKKILAEKPDLFNIETIKGQLTTSLNIISKDPLAIKEYFHTLGVKQFDTLSKKIEELSKNDMSSKEIERLSKEEINQEIDNIFKNFNEHVKELQMKMGQAEKYINYIHNELKINNNTPVNERLKAFEKRPELRNLYFDLRHLYIDLDKRLDKLNNNAPSFTQILEFEKKYPSRAESINNLYNSISNSDSLQKLKEERNKKNEQHIENLEKYIADRKLKAEEANRYKPKGGPEEKHYESWFSKVFRGFSDEDKIKAAEALINAIKNNDKLESKHLKALEQGTLKEVAEEALKQFKPK